MNRYVKIFTGVNNKLSRSWKLWDGSYLLVCLFTGKSSQGVVDKFLVKFGERISPFWRRSTELLFCFPFSVFFLSRADSTTEIIRSTLVSFYGPLSCVEVRKFRRPVNDFRGRRRPRMKLCLHSWADAVCLERGLALPYEKRLCAQNMMVLPLCANFRVKIHS